MSSLSVKEKNKTTMPHVHDLNNNNSPRNSLGAAATLADVAAVARTRRARRGGCCLLFPAVPLFAAAALITGAILWALFTPKAIDATRGLLRLLEPQGQADKPLPPPDVDPTKWTRAGTFEAIVVGIAARAQVGGMAAIIALAGVALLSAILTVAGGVAERRSGIGSGSRGGGNCCSSLRAAAGAHGALAFISWLAMAGFVALFALYGAWLGSAVVGDAVLGASGSFASLLQQAASGAALADAAAGGGSGTATCAPDCVALLGAAASATDTLPSAFLSKPVSSSDPAIRCLCSAAGLAATKAAAKAVARAVGPALAGVALLAVAASWLYGGSTAGCARTGATAEMAREWDKMAAEAEAVAAAGGAGAGAFGYSAGGLVNGGNGGGGGGGAYSGNGALEGRPPALGGGGGGFNGSYTYYGGSGAGSGAWAGSGQQHRLANESGGVNSAWAVEEGDAGAAAASTALRRAVTGTTTPRYG
jgi:hypothetical protein